MALGISFPDEIVSFHRFEGSVGTGVAYPCHIEAVGRTDRLRRGVGVERVHGFERG